MIAIRAVAEASSPASPPSPASRTGDTTPPEGGGTGLWAGGSVTEDRIRGDEGDGGDGLLRPPSDEGLEVSREALRIFGDDLTEESAARLQAVVDGRDGYEWGGLA